MHAAKSLVDQLAIVGKLVPDEDLISYLVGGLTPCYNAFITSFSFMTKDAPMSLEDFQTQLFSHEQLLNNQLANTEAGTFALYFPKVNNNNCKPRFSNNQKQSQSRFSN
jgi:hypothetical protein